MSAIDDYMQKLIVTNPLREPLLRTIIRALQLPSGSHGLDAGCGIGLQTLLLAEAVKPAGHVTGLDIVPEFLVHAGNLAEQAGFSEYVSFQQGDVGRLPFDDDAFDWAWSADCVGYHPAEPLPLLRELARVVKPGGSVNILFWSSQQLLPGYPVLEARLNATAAGIAPFVKGKRPVLHPLCLLHWFREAELKNPVVRTFVGDVHAPLSAEIREAFMEFFPMRWGTAKRDLSQEDWTQYQRLCQPQSPDFILDCPEYYAFFTYSLFRGMTQKA